MYRRADGYFTIATLDEARNGSKVLKRPTGVAAARSFAYIGDAHSNLGKFRGIFFLFFLKITLIGILSYFML